MITGLAFAIQGQLLAIPSEVLPRRWRASAQSLMNCSSGLGGTIAIFAMGPFAKGVSSYDSIAECFNSCDRNLKNWRGIFYTLAGLYGVAMILLVIMYRPAQKRPDVSGISHHRKLMKANILIRSIVILF